LLLAFLQRNLVSKRIQIGILETVMLPLVQKGLETLELREEQRLTETEVVQDQGAEENIWIEEG
jgi:hypothetical protein